MIRRRGQESNQKIGGFGQLTQEFAPARLFQAGLSLNDLRNLAPGSPMRRGRRRFLGGLKHSRGGRLTARLRGPCRLLPGGWATDRERGDHRQSARPATQRSALGFHSRE